MYINERIKGVEDIQNGITVDNIVLYDKLRIFSGDGPARQFELLEQILTIIKRHWQYFPST
jgi:hypothetical protein